MPTNSAKLVLLSELHMNCDKTGKFSMPGNYTSLMPHISLQHCLGKFYCYNYSNKVDKTPDLITKLGLNKANYYTGQ